MEKGKQNFLKGISRNVILLGFVSLLTDLSGQMVFPLLPLYLTSVLGAGAVGVGAVEGAAEAAASLLKVISGYWSDKIRKRKPFVFIGYLLSAVMKPVLAFAGSWPVVLLIRTFDRVGKGLRDAPRDALIAESSGRSDSRKIIRFPEILGRTWVGRRGCPRVHSPSALRIPEIIHTCYHTGGYFGYRNIIRKRKKHAPTSFQSGRQAGRHFSKGENIKPGA